MDAHEIAAVDAFFDQGIHWDYLWHRVSELPLRIELQTAVQCALGYELDPMLPNGSYGPFRPLWSGPGGVSAPPPGDIDEATRLIWRDLGAACSAAPARSLFNDLLWVAKAGNAPAANARAAVEAYRHLAGVNWDAAAEPPEDGSGAKSWGSYRRAPCLVRALQIALELRDDPLAAEVRDELLKSLAAATGESIAAAGIFLRGLVQLPVRLRIPAIYESAKDALDRYGTTAHNFEEFGDFLKEFLADSQARRAVEDQQLDRWMEQARGSTGLARLVELQKAAEFAAARGLKGRMSEIRAELDHLKYEDLGLKSVSASVTIPTDEIEEFTAYFLEPDDWPTALTRFAGAGGSAPSGDNSKNLSLLEDIRRDAPLLSLVSRIVIDSQQRPVAHPSTDLERQRIDLAHHEQFAISIWASIATSVLKGLRAKLGEPTEDELIQYFTTEIISSEIAAKIAHGFVLYFRGAWDDSAHALVPRIEAIVRQICLAAGIPVSREAAGRDDGGVATLGTLLRELQERGFDISWSRYLRNSLTENVGLNLRNRVAHGLMDEVGEFDAAILLHIAALCRAIEVRSSSSSIPKGP